MAGTARPITEEPIFPLPWREGVRGRGKISPPPRPSPIKGKAENQKIKTVFQEGYRRGRNGADSKSAWGLIHSHVGSNPTPSAMLRRGKRVKGEKGKREKPPGGFQRFKRDPMGLTYISKSCEIYLGEDSPYREDMGSLPLDCIIRQKSIMRCRRRRKRITPSWCPKAGVGGRGSDRRVGLGAPF